ncbi:MAG TPA: hypothetical protein VMR33_07150 [Candidatus Baltobacteraceae bacterium]|jgi:hypothetical protein|nr:hypothetical protein [Candidatus Baltobacteraceae bacterium]
MEPITITIAIIGSILVASCWPYIVDFFSTKIIPWLRERVSTTLADILAEALVFADKGITPVRRTVKNIWKYFQQTLLGMKMEVRKTSATTATAKTTTIVRDENGKLVQSTITEELSWDQLPREIREEMTRQNTTAASLDLKNALAEKFRKNAQDQGVVLEMAN